MKITLYALVLLTSLAGCSGNSSSDGVKNAKGDTPVKYIVCSPGEKSCFVAARFNDLDSCQNHKNWSEMLCDSRSSPGKMVCTKDNGPTVSVAYCTL